MKDETKTWVAATAIASGTVTAFSGAAMFVRYINELSNDSHITRECLQSIKNNDFKIIIPNALQNLSREALTDKEALKKTLQGDEHYLLACMPQKVKEQSEVTSIKINLNNQSQLEKAAEIIIAEREAKKQAGATQSGSKSR